jgi:hypothetical protein
MIKKCINQIIFVKNIRDILNLEIYDIYRTNVPPVLFVSYRDLHLEIDIFGHLSMNFYDKRDALLLRTIYLHLSSNVPTSSAYKVYISRLIRHYRARGS